MANIFYLFVLCMLASITGAAVATATTTEKAKVTPQNVSALYIGDLLRTKPKEVLDAAGSVQQPILLNQGHLPRVRPNFDQQAKSVLYKAHGGHEYLEAEYARPESRNYIPVNIRTSPRAAPVIGHLLSIKPVRVVPKEALPLARHTKPHQKTSHYEGDDCHKGGDHSSEEKQHDPEERIYRRDKQVISDHSLEYRSPRGRYEDDRSEEYSSHTEPYSGSYDSKTYPSDTNSQSKTSGSFSKSKSTSTSRTLTPNRSRQTFQIGLKDAPPRKEHGESTTPAHEDQGVLVYKVREPKERPSYSSNNGGEYPPQNDDSAEKTGTPYSQYHHTSQAGEHKKDSSRGKAHYSGQVKERERPHHYSTPYEADHGSYEQSTYSPSGQKHFTEQYKPTQGYQGGRDYAPPSTLKNQDHYGAAPYQDYQAPGSGDHHQMVPKKQQSKKRQYTSHTKYGSTSGSGKEDGTYKNVQSPQAYAYDERYSHSSRPKSEFSTQNYESYESQSTTPSGSGSQSHHRNQPNSGLTGDKEIRPYGYEATTHYEENGNHNLRSQKRRYHDSPRYARSPEQYLNPTNVEERTMLPFDQNKPIILMSRESKPYVSRSVSYSNSDGTSNVSHQQPVKQETTDGRQSMPFDVENPTVYKPYNSEYPASYANDPHHSSGRQQYAPQNYDQLQSYEQPASYEDAPPKYQSSEENGPYDQRDSPEDYDEDINAPEKKNKDHQYISNIEGYRDEYQSSVPLHLDDAFFEKYGISKNAKIIVASALKPNLFVADGTKIPDKGHDSVEPGPSYQTEPAEGHSGSEEERFEPTSTADKDSYNNESPEELGVPKELPGSFDDLVDTNPKFLLRNLPSIMKPGDTFFRDDDTFDDNDFHNVEHKGFVVSQGPREIVQQHGDGVSRILFNVPKQEDRIDDEVVSAAGALLKSIVKSDS